MSGLLGLLNGILTGALSLVSSLSQQQTNGASLFGTLQAPTLPQFLTSNPLPFGYPWGLLDSGHSSPYTQMPSTGVYRIYDFTISRGKIAPDGYQKDVILVNGQYPGPTIEANWGDTIMVNVHNQISGPAEGVALHWHGLQQQGTPWYDGVPAVSQCPIAPYNSFTYTFKASLYGTTWYHSHYSAQLAGGLVGPLIIHGPKNADYDIDLGPVFLTDWFHGNYFDILQSVMGPGGNPQPASDNNLINGKMVFDCTTVAPGDKAPCNSNAGLSKFKFTAGKTHRLRLINAGSEGIQRFSIDGHSMTVVANDFVEIQPYTTNVVTLGVGQRSDVLVTATANPNSAFWMRSNISTACNRSKQPNALAAIYYNTADTTKAPTSTAWNVPDPGTCANDDLSLTAPYFPMNAATPSATQTMLIDAYVNSTGSFLWRLDGQSFRGNYNDPILLQASKGNFTFPPEYNVKNIGSNTTVRFIINNPGPASHPMHLHGHNMQILSEGPGSWDGTIVNAANPQRRDVQLVRAGGHFVFQFQLDNPGVWPFHCHIAWHVSGGLYANILERPNDIKTNFNVPFVLPQTCLGWKLWSLGNVVDQIDSGL